jgi:hypothetical protein
MGIIEDQNITFQNLNSAGTNHKTVGPLIVNNHFSVMCHISSIKNSDTIQDFIDNVTLAINGDFNEIIDPDVSTNDDVAFITESGVEIWDDAVENVWLMYPLLSFKEMLIAWREFLMTAPFHGTKIDQKSDKKRNFWSRYFKK